MTRLLQPFLLFTVCCLFASCYDEPWERGDVDGYVPIYSTDATLKQISFQPPRKTVNGGKLFTAGTNVLQEEMDSGLHIISYQDPAHPVKTGFLRIPGFQVAAIEGDYLYANNYNDLIAIPLKALSANMMVGRVTSVWTQVNYPTATDAGYFECADPSKGIVIGWRKARIKNPKCRIPSRGYDGLPPSKANNRSNPGLVASGGKLYLVSPEALAVYSLSAPGQPVILNERNMPGSRVDTIFLFNKELAVMNTGALDLYDTANISSSHYYYYSVPYCLKLMAIGDTAYGITDRRCGNAAYLTQYSLRKDTNTLVELSRLSIPVANAFAAAGRYIYVAEESGFTIIDATRKTPEIAGDVNSYNYSDVVVNGNLLFFHSDREIACYSLATSPVNPVLISNLPY